MITNGNKKITVVLLPPETTTPMPPCLHYDYDRDLGWPGRPEDYRPDEPKRSGMNAAFAAAVARLRQA